MCVWDIRARTHLRTVKLHDDVVHVSTVVGPRIITSSPDGTVAVTDWRTGQKLWKKTLSEAEARTHGPGPWVGNTVFAHAVWGGQVVVGTGDGRLWVFDIASGYVRSDFSIDLTLIR